MATLITKLKIRRGTTAELKGTKLEEGELCCAIESLKEGQPKEVTKFTIGVNNTPFELLPNLIEGMSNKGVFFIVGDKSPSAEDEPSKWTGSQAKIKDLYDGLTIVYIVPSDSSLKGATLQINSFEAVPVYRNNKLLITELHQDDVVLLTYHVTESEKKWIWQDADSFNLSKQYGAYEIAQDPSSENPETHATKSYTIYKDQLVFLDEKYNILPSISQIINVSNTQTIFLNNKPFSGFSEIFYCTKDFEPLDKNKALIKDSSVLKIQDIVSLKKYQNLFPSNLTKGPLFISCIRDEQSIDQFILKTNDTIEDFKPLFYNKFNQPSVDDVQYNECVANTCYIYLGQIVDEKQFLLELSAQHSIYYYDTDIKSFSIYFPNKILQTVAVHEVGFKTVDVVQDIETNYNAEQAKDELVSRKAVYDFVAERQGTKLNQTQIDNINSIPNKASTEDVNAGLSLKVNKAGDEMTGPLTMAAGDGNGILFKDRTSNININEDSQTKTLLGFLSNNFTIGHSSINTTIRGAQTYLTGNNLDIGNTGNSGLIAKGVSCHTDYTTIHTKQERALFIQEGESGVVNIGGTPSTTAAQDMSAKLIVNGDIKEGTQNLSDKYQAKGNYLTEHQDISGKADKTYVNTELDKKANSSGTYDSLIAGKAKELSTSDNTKVAAEGLNELNIYYNGPSFINYRGGSNTLYVGNGDGTDTRGALQAGNIYSNNKLVLTDHQDISGKADKTYVNTELGKKANTTDIPTITLNGKTTKTPDFVAPINEGEIKTKFRIANKGYSETVVYYPLVKLPINNSGNYASLLISGRIGGWVDNNMSFFQAIVYNRGTCGISVFDIAGSGVPSDIYDLSDIVIYQEEDNSATVYIKATRYFTYDIDIEVFQSSAQIIYNGETKIPTGVLKAQASTTTSRFELYQGKATINGEQVATTTELTNGLNSKQQKGDYATTTELNNGLASKQPKGNYATTTEVNAKVSLADVSNAGFIKNTTNAFNYNNLKGKPTATETWKSLQDMVLNAVYPVGSVYITMDVESPANLFGGTWEPLPGEAALWVIAANTIIKYKETIPVRQGELPQFTGWGIRGGQDGTSGGIVHKKSIQLSNANAGKYGADYEIDSVLESNSIYTNKKNLVKPTHVIVHAWVRVG